MPISVLNSGPPLTSADLAELETYVGVALPMDYKVFLLKHNGGLPRPAWFPAPGWVDGNFAQIQCLYMFRPTPTGCSDLLWVDQAFAGRIPIALMPIGLTDQRDQLCMWLVGEQRGRIALWDRDAEHQPPTDANVYTIAPSFREFVQSLRELPDNFVWGASELPIPSSWLRIANRGRGVCYETR